MSVGMLALVFAVSALIVTILSAIGKAPLWVGVILLCVAVLLGVR